MNTKMVWRSRWGRLLFSIALVAPLAGMAADRSMLDWLSSKFGAVGRVPMPLDDPAQQQAAGAAQHHNGKASLQMATSPDGGGLELVLSAIESAKSSILVAAYSFTSKPIAEALLRKQQAGLSVMVVLDKSQLTERYTSATFLANAGIPVRINARYAIQHSKMLVIDGDTVQTGSFNYTNAAARRNSENVLVIWHHPALAQRYSEYWQRLWSEGEAYPARN